VTDEFGVEGARHVAGIIRNNVTIKHLYLGLNNLGEEGGLLIADALKENKVFACAHTSECMPHAHK
jgi:Ran GTPase-activating protein (RanGAP) involved in mRNA processing and transport